MKQGFVNPETGLVFWSRQASCSGGIRWLTPEQFQKKMEQVKNWKRSDRGKEMNKQRRNTDEHRSKRNEYAKVWRSTESRKEKARNYMRQRRATNHVACVADRMRARLSEAFRAKGFKRGSTTEKILGCSWEFLLSYLESRFREGMTWENRGKWHIDHITPLASAKTEEEIMSLCRYTNLQPLWSHENQSKGARIKEANK